MEVAKTKTAPMKQKHTLQWLSAVTGRAKGLVGLLVVVQTVLSVSSIAFAFVLRRIINMAVDGVQGGFWASLALLVGILLGQIVLSATGRFLSEYTSAAVENRFKHRLFSALLTELFASGELTPQDMDGIMYEMHKAYFKYREQKREKERIMNL